MLLALHRAMETENDTERRLETRKQLIALMIEHGYNPEYRAHIPRLFEWVMILPETLEQQVEQFVLDAPTLEAFEETLRLHHSKKADG